MAVPQIVEDNRSPVEQFIDQVIDKDRLDALAREMPSHIKPDLFKRNLLNAIMINPDLMNYQPGLLFREASKAAALGLLLDPQLGEAYMVVSYNYKTKSQEPQLRVGYKGLIKLARQSGEIEQVYAHEVREADYIECELGADKKLIHKPKLFSDRGPVIGYYSVMKMKDGSFDFEPMSVEQCRAIRDRTDAWKAFTEKKIKSTPWATDEDEMSKKTTIRRLMKRAPQSPQIADALRIEDNADGFAPIERAPRLVPPAPPKPPIATIEHRKEPTAETVEQATPARVPPKPPAPPAPPKAAPVVEATPADVIDGEDVISNFQAAAESARDEGTLEEAYAEYVKPVEAKLFPPDLEQCDRIYREAVRRIGG